MNLSPFHAFANASYHQALRAQVASRREHRTSYLVGYTAVCSLLVDPTRTPLSLLTELRDIYTDMPPSPRQEGAMAAIEDLEAIRQVCVRFNS